MVQALCCRLSMSIWVCAFHWPGFHRRWSAPGCDVWPHWVVVKWASQAHGASQLPLPVVAVHKDNFINSRSKDKCWAWILNRHIKTHNLTKTFRQKMFMLCELYGGNRSRMYSAGGVWTLRASVTECFTNSWSLFKPCTPSTRLLTRFRKEEKVSSRGPTKEQSRMDYLVPW